MDDCRPFEDQDLSIIEAAAGSPPLNNLVPPMTSFVGREAEIEQVRRLMDEARLVTITGPPGAGKTRLADAVARRTLDRFDGGTWLVELASLSDPGLVLSTVAAVVGVPASAASSPLDSLVARFDERSTLVILDNFEHVIPAAAEVGALLARAPRVHLLVTSRTLLRLSGEHEYVLPPLQVPQAEVDGQELAATESVELFRRRAVAADPTFQVTGTNAADLGELCRRLDGLPLALELAAARVRLMPLAAILARVDHRLALLSDGPRDSPERHQNLRAAVAWSYDLLEPAAQQLFRQLSVFRGSWTIEGAAAVHGVEAPESEAVIDLLSALVDSSLVVRDPSGDPEPRFTMLETLREFGAEALEHGGETDEARDRHAIHYLALAQREAPGFTGPDPGGTLDRIARDHDNLRAALGHFLDHEPASALRLGSALWRFWQMRGHLLEGDRWLSAALQAAGTAVPDADRADALAAKGSLAYWRGDIAGARPSYEETLALRRGLGDDAHIADALYDLAFVFAPYFFPPPADPERTEQGARLLREAAELYRVLGNEPGLARTDWILANFTLYRDVREAEPMLRESVEQFRRLNDPFGLGWALRMHGCSLLATLDTARADAAFREALGLFAAAADGSALGLLLGDLGDVARLEGDGIRAARLKGASAGLRQATGASLANVDQVPWLVHPRPLEEVIAPGALERALAEGRAMSQNEAIAYALGRPANAPDRALRVTALGPFAVERSGVRLTHWGGPKAGSRQAQAMFGFLLDRGERGVTKDEFIEVIWPDADMAQGDLNFHRTLGGLRATLEPHKGDDPSSPIIFGNGRYRLRPGLVGWYDVVEFDDLLVHAALATDELGAIRGLEAARALYRNDFLEDCQVYGDSEYVQDHRTSLRGRFTDALVDLGRRHERRGDAALAAGRFREALAVAGGECPSASEGLQRLGVAVR